MDLVFDIEANGLLEESTSIHCICGNYINDGEILSDKFSLYNNLLNKDTILSYFTRADKIIGHNIIKYDIPMLKKFYDIDLINLLGIERIVDTYILSQLFFPDRQLPRGCPTAVFNPIIKKIKKIGPHSLEAWGYRVGHKKIEIHDWREFNQDIIERCEIDVLINAKAYFLMMKEAGL